MFRKLLCFESAELVVNWSAIDDRIMGGISQSYMRYDPAGYTVFEGIVSLEQNGGFASVRSHPFDLGMADVVNYLLEVRGDGKRYKLNLRANDTLDGVNYQAIFETRADTWMVVRLPVSTFVPTRRGRTVPYASPLDPARVRQIGFMIANRQAGAFALALRSLGVE